ncbi:MAG: ATP-dependent zinc metalloprotease FtsH [Treponema sp.]|nr:ATP-dependent zinc metalloprotease FtsH [Spirochaetia bacterium]MDY2839715.1 ATP-dependent zinc metalloprotease FtsH [Treponema sp.]
MAEDQNNKPENNDDENDPYKFFKFAGPSENNDNDKKKKDPKKKKFPLWPILLITLAVIIVVDLFVTQRPDNLIDYSEFKARIESGQITYVEIGENYCVGYGPSVVKESDSNGKGLQLFSVQERRGGQQFKTSSVLMQSFITLLDEKGVQYKFVQKQNNYILQLVLSWIIPLALIFLMYFFIFKKMGGGSGGGMGSIFNAGGSRAKVVEEGKIKTRFSDVAGVDEAKEELVEVVDFLKEPKKYTDIGGKIPKGVLLVGPPGTGKTLLARAVAGEAGVPYFSISGSDFVEMFVGVGASRVRDLFKQAREKAPCIVFIDEIDALAKSRVNGFGGGNDEREQTLNQLLVEMDGFDNEKGLIILAATNRADILDPAILRPGRFDRHVPVELPDVKGREAILRIHSKNVKLDSDVDFESIAHGTTGFAGADLANVVNEAALLAVRNGRKKVTMEDLNEAIDKVSIGLKKKSRKDNKKEMRLVSVHETGHALVGAFTPGHEPVNKITVVPRSHGVGGFTQYREEEEKNFKTRQDMINEVDSLLGGRAAEQIILGDISTGASNDIARATEILKSMIVDFGMSDKFRNMTLGKGVLGNRGGEPNLVREFSEVTQNYVDDEIARIMEERYNYVLNLLSEHKDLLDYIANRLLEIETMDGKEFYEIVKGEMHCKELADQSNQAAIEVAEKTAESSEEKTDEPESSEEVKPE